MKMRNLGMEGTGIKSFEGVTLGDTFGVRNGNDAFNSQPATDEFSQAGGKLYNEALDIKGENQKLWRTAIFEAPVRNERRFVNKQKGDMYEYTPVAYFAERGRFAGEENPTAHKLDGDMMAAIFDMFNNDRPVNVYKGSIIGGGRAVERIGGKTLTILGEVGEENPQPVMIEVELKDLHNPMATDLVNTDSIKDLTQKSLVIETALMILQPDDGVKVDGYAKHLGI
ncbi:MAG TPA: hypothetical protein VHA74_01170 [Candidatus Dojkabacteria bacterium]|nr:hypothetical protein [Candidatus Dojkabacteria bacterium]